MRFRPTAGLLLSTLALGACQTTDEVEPSELNYLVNRGRFEEALDVAEQLVDENPDDEFAQDQLRLTLIASLLDQGRALCFHDRDDEAMDLFLEALALAPERSVIRDWISKTHRKLAFRWLDAAHALASREELDEAAEAYETAITHLEQQAAFDYAGAEPEGRDEARQGLSSVLLRLNYRMGRGETYYTEGVDHLRDYWLEQARWSLLKSAEMRPDHEATRLRIEEVNQSLAQERLAIARDFESQGLYPAARNEYRMVLLFEEENEEAKVGYRRMGDEMSVNDFLDQADMALRKGELDESEELVGHAARLTSLQEEAVILAQADIKKARFQIVYDRAYDLEQDHRYEEASVVYAELLTSTEYFADARSRKETLDEMIERTQTLYAQAESATSAEDEAFYLRQIEVIWPEYKDVEERLIAFDEAEPRR